MYMPRCNLGPRLTYSIYIHLYISQPKWAQGWADRVSPRLGYGIHTSRSAQACPKAAAAVPRPADAPRSAATGAGAEGPNGCEP